MKKAYLLIFNDSLGSQENVKSCLNQIPLILDWRYEMPNSFFWVSEESAKSISGKIDEYFNQDHRRYIIGEITDNVYGWLTGDGWYLIQHKVRKPKE